MNSVARLEQVRGGTGWDAMKIWDRRDRRDQRSIYGGEPILASMFQRPERTGVLSVLSSSGGSLLDEE